MAKIDELIRKAQEEVNRAKDDDRPVAQAKLDALKEAKSAGIEMDNTEVNGVVTRKTNETADKWKNLVGMDYDEAEKLFEDLEDDTVRTLLGTGDSGDGEGDDDKPVAERIQEALRSRDTKIENLSTSLTDVNRRYSADKVETAVEKAFRAASIDPAFLEPAKRLASYDDLVQKVAGGQSVTNEEINAKVEGVKTLSGVWFKEGDGEEDTKDGLTVAGHRLKEEAVRPHIPATPAAQETAEITDEDRAARAASVY